MELVFPTMAHKDMVLAYKQEHSDAGEAQISGSNGLMQATNYEGWLDMVTRAQTQAPENWVKGMQFLALEDNVLVGMIAVRYTLNDYLFHFGGHIGYGVRPSQRRKGYATQMLALALAHSRAVGLDKVLITCNQDNIGSARTIQKNGGVWENTVVEEDGQLLERYWITL